MATLQVRSIDERLYGALGRRAEMDHRSISQEVVAILNDFDLIIGVTALSLNYAVVTNNERHFRRIPGLRVENWTK